MFLGVSALLNSVDVFDPFHFLVCFLIPSFNVISHHQRHAGVFLEIDYSCNEQVLHICEFTVGVLEFAFQEHRGLCGVLIIFSQMV